MKKVAGRLKLELTQFRELAAFAQFGSDLDKSTQAQLDRGQRLTEVLKQPQYLPVALDHQVMTIFAATNGFLDKVPVSALRRWEDEFVKFMDEQHADIGNTILRSKDLDATTADGLKLAISDFNATFTA